MPTPYNAPYKVLQRKAKAQRQSPGYPFWVSCVLRKGPDVDAVTGLKTNKDTWVKVPEQGTYRREG